MNRLLNEIKNDEGFMPNPYKDSLGIPTIGYGTKLPLDKDEAELLLKHRFEKIKKELEQRVLFLKELDQQAQDILLNMAYNMGVPRLLGFKRMLKALNQKDYKRASDEMIDSKWYKQVGDRARRLVLKMHNLG